MQDVCNGIHRSLAPNFRYGLLWGKSSKFNPHAQKVSLSHQVADEDVVSSMPPYYSSHVMTLIAS
jgi:ribosome-interacting GTPase 1